MTPIQLGPIKRRAAISRGKMEMVAAIVRVINGQREFWPLSVRRVHYLLLNDPPLKHTSKPDSFYCNDERSYNDLTKQLIRMRIEGMVPKECIDDETRPSTVWDVCADPQEFIRAQRTAFLEGYWRDLMQSQIDHFEIHYEKNTLQSIVEPVAGEYRIPTSSGRGYASFSPRVAMAQRFLASGKQRLVVLILSDFDPDGEEIAHSFARSMRDDLGIDSILAFKVGLTADQVLHHRLPAGRMEAKRGSSNYKKFVKKYGRDTVHELEALEPRILQQELREAIEAVVDMEAFAAELSAEESDQRHVAELRDRIDSLLKF